MAPTLRPRRDTKPKQPMKPKPKPITSKKTPLPISMQLKLEASYRNSCNIIIEICEKEMLEARRRAEYFRVMANRFREMAKQYPGAAT